MAPLSVAEPSVASGFDSLKVWFVPFAAGVNPLSVAELEGATKTGIDVTQSFTQDSGFNAAATQNMITDPRLGKSQTFSRIGTTDPTLSTKYVAANTAADVARTAFEKGTIGWFVERRGVDNATAATAAQLVNVYPVQAGEQVADAVAANAVDTITQSWAITGPVQRFQPLVA